jgi:polar amino acid transport system substrate-binding protein
MRTCCLANRFSATLLALAGILNITGEAVAQSQPDGLARIRQQGRLVAGVDYVVPAYVATTKFRTPETIDTALAEDVAKRLKVSLTAVRADVRYPAQPGPDGMKKPDLAIAAFSGIAPARPGAILIPTGYVAGPMAIMRSDTTIKTWEQLRGRKVCVAEGGAYTGTLAAKYGATEIVHKAPADALLALRIGTCDATVHDNVLLEELLKLPEWKKFSARLPAGPRKTQAFVVPAEDRALAGYLRQVTQEWHDSGHLAQLMNKMARSIAFEVYLDQDVPDCH